jgi:hypothetical protein
MSSIMIQDLTHAKQLDSHSMVRVRGGSGFGPGSVNVNLTLNQQIAQFQDIGVNVLNNNGVIGAGFTGPNVELSPLQWAKNEAVVPKF